MTFSRVFNTFDRDYEKHHLPNRWRGEDEQQRALMETATSLMKDIYLLIGPEYEFHYGLYFWNKNIEREVLGSECGNMHALVDPCAINTVAEWYDLSVDQLRQIENTDPQDLTVLFDWVPSTFNYYWNKGDSYESDNWVGDLIATQVPVRQLRHQLRNIRNNVGPVIVSANKKGFPDNDFWKKPRRLPLMIDPGKRKEILKLDLELERVVYQWGVKYQKVPFWWDRDEDWKEVDEANGEGPLEEAIKPHISCVQHMAGDWQVWADKHRENYVRYHEQEPE